jgi:DNA replication and repair protein RecF
MIVRDVRCIARADVRLHPGTNLFTGTNAQGKTSFLEAVSILLRLQSPRTRRLAEVLRRDARGLVVDGWFGEFHLQFYYSPERRKLALDSVEQRSPARYLEAGRVVWFANDDIELVRGGADARRAFVDQLALQVVPGYRVALHAYTHALRSRNRLLRLPRVPSAELAAFNPPFLEHGTRVMEMRAAVLARLGPDATSSHARIARASQLDFVPVPGQPGPLAEAMEATRVAERQARQTLVGPHRDDIELRVDGHPAARFASEGQQRSVVLAARLAQAALLERSAGFEPVLLLDDVFGELDSQRRSALLEALPVRAQKLIATTRTDAVPAGSVDFRFQVSSGTINPG